MRKMKWTATGLATLALLLAGPARAETDFGIRGGLYSDAESGFLGIELLTDFTGQWFLNPNLEYVFVDEGTLATLNLDAHYDFRTNAPYYLWLGGGLAVIYEEVDLPPRLRRQGVDDSETDIGANLLAGIGFGKGQAIRPYLQGKVILSDETEAVLAVGLRFH